MNEENLRTLLRGMCVIPRNELDERVQREIDAVQLTPRVLSEAEYNILQRILEPYEMAVVDCFYIDNMSLQNTSIHLRMTQKETYDITNKALLLLEKRVRKSL